MNIVFMESILITVTQTNVSAYIVAVFIEFANNSDKCTFPTEILIA